MGSRIILPFGCSGEYVKKIIPDDPSLKFLKFYPLDDFYNDVDIIYKHPTRNNTPIWSAIIQQYSEWLSWNVAPEEIKQFLAPIVATYSDDNGLPVLCYPRFTPLLDEGAVFEHSDNENILLAGKRLEHFHVSDETTINFYRGLPQVIDYLGLVESDIIINPSNVGYNPTFGLRIIDYGLTEA